MSEICERLHKLFSRLEEHRFPFDEELIPDNGIYILFEKGESAHGVNRIVRVGTHTGRKTKLISRLNEHFINPNKDRSIFRKNIGRALLNRNKEADFLGNWNIKLSLLLAEVSFSEKERAKILNKITATEQEVSHCIQENFYFVAFVCEGRANRRNLESKIISTVSLCKECSPSKNWLGLHSPVIRIRDSGLWLVQGLYKEPSLTSAEFEALELSCLDK